MLTFILPAIVVVALSLPLIKVFKGEASVNSAKKRLGLHISGVVGAAALVLFLGVANAPVFAAGSAITGTIAQGLGFLAAALATGMSALKYRMIKADGIAAAAAPAAIGAFSENAENFGRSLIFVALGEGVAIYGLLISILIINQL